MNNPSPLIGGLVPALLTGPNHAVLQPLITQFKQQLNERYVTHPDLLTAFTQLEKQPDKPGRQLSFQEEAETAQADKDLILLNIIQQIVAALPPTPPTVTITASGGSAVAYGQGSTAVGARGVHVGGTVHGSIVTGDVQGQTIGIGEQVTQTLGSDPLTLAEAFERITQAVAKSQGDKEMARTAVKVLQEEAQKEDAADADRTEYWLDKLLKTLPDIAEVVLDTLIHPVKGLSTIVRKVALRAREGRKPEKPHGS